MMKQELKSTNIRSMVAEQKMSELKTARQTRFSSSDGSQLNHVRTTNTCVSVTHTGKRIQRMQHNFVRCLALERDVTCVHMRKRVCA